jgi:hypothetical protein
VNLDLRSLSLRPAGQHLGVRPDVWLRATIVIAGTEHFVDLVRVERERSGEQRAHSKDLDAMLSFHHMACGADGPFSTVRLGSHAYVLFVTPYCD